MHSKNCLGQDEHPYSGKAHLADNEQGRCTGRAQCFRAGNRDREVIQTNWEYVGLSELDAKGDLGPWEREAPLVIMPRERVIT